MWKKIITDVVASEGQSNREIKKNRIKVKADANNRLDGLKTAITATTFLIFFLYKKNLLDTHSKQQSLNLMRNNLK